MKSTIYFSEINQLLNIKGIKATLLSCYDDNCFRVNYTLKFLFFIKKEVSAFIMMKGFDDNTIDFKFSLIGLGSLENTAKNVIKNKLPDFISLVNDNELKVNIGNIPALKKSGIRLRLNNIIIDKLGFIVDLKI